MTPRESNLNLICRRARLSMMRMDQPDGDVLGLGRHVVELRRGLLRINDDRTHQAFLDLCKALDQPPSPAALAEFLVIGREASSVLGMAVKSQEDGRKLEKLGEVQRLALLVRAYRQAKTDKTGKAAALRREIGDSIGVLEQVKARVDTTVNREDAA